MTFCAHARVGKNLRDCILGSRRFFARVCFTQRVDVIHRMVVRDELQRLGDAVVEVVLPDGGHERGGPASRRRHINGGPHGKERILTPLLCPMSETAPTAATPASYNRNRHGRSCTRQSTGGANY